MNEKKPNRNEWLIGALFLLAVGVSCWQYSAAQNGGAPEQPATGPTGLVRSADLGGDQRYLAHLSTDKPIYRLGETVFVRGVLLHAVNQKPLADNLAVFAVVEIQGPKGDVVAGGNATTQNSSLGFQWTIPDGQAGGEYTIKTTFPDAGFPPAERKFDIRAYRAPRLKSQIKFLRDGYGPGDEVAATLHTERAEGGIPAGANVIVTARVDGVETFRGNARVDQHGDALVRFALPTDIARGEGTLALIIEDGGVVETASKTIPILLQTVDLTAYPEGGQIVAGLENRVYFEAFTPAKKPADLAGVVIDDAGNEIVKFRSEHEGRGRFRFTPEAGKRYFLQITEPSGINDRYPVPEVVEEGVVLTTERDIFASDSPVKVTVQSTAPEQQLLVTLAKREQVIASRKTVGDKADIEFALSAESPTGVLVATVWDDQGKPLAERLVFRQPRGAVNVEISADLQQYVPGSTARLKLKTTDREGKPVKAVVGLTVTDDSVLEMIEKREQSPRLPAMVLLEGEVRELADAHVYLDPENDEAPAAVDLLLGTQGWRRFAFVNTAEFIKQHNDDARRVLAMRMATLEEVEKLGMQFNKGFGGGLGGAVPEAPADFAGGIPVEAALPLPPGAEADGAPPKPQANAIPNRADPGFLAPPPVDEAASAGAVPADARDDKLDAAAAAPAAPPVASEPQPDEQSRLRRQQLAQALGDAEEAKDRDALFARELQSDLALQRNDFVAIRVYAHQVRADRQPGDRVDFTETLFWHAGLQTDENGEAEIEFGLNDAVTSFRVLADAFSDAGSLGAASTLIESVKPFYLEPKLPLEVTMGDVIHSPIGVVNATGDRLDRTKVRIVADGSQQVVSAITPFSIGPDERVRRMMNVHVGKFNGEAAFTISADAGPYADKVTRTMMVKPLGFTWELGHGGLIGPGETVSHEIEIPGDLVKGSLNSRIVVYPTPLASMTEALERLIREPYGCFEQTSSTTYPLVMAQQYFMSHQGVDPSLIERSSEILAKGYDRLLGFECKSGGFEWFGHDPGHDALTAYGLLEFTDMSQVRYVDPAMLDRTRTWLLAQRNGQGGFERKTHTLHCWVAEPEIANTYNTWALLEAGVDADLATEVSWIRDAAERTENTYVTALAANVLALAGDDEGANHMLDKLAGKQSEDGSLGGATRSVVGSTGEALTIETSALAMLAWLKNPRYAENVERGIKYLAENCKAGRFGSTQSTVLALRAIVAYDQSRAKPKALGQLQLLVDGQSIGQATEFTADTQGAIELADIAEYLGPGKHQVQIAMTGGSQMPYSVAVELNRLTPDSSESCSVHLNVALRDRQIEEGTVTEAAVSITNRQGETVPNPIAIVGIPGGLEVRHDQLKELVAEGRIAAYEVRGREVVLYWRALEAEQRVDLPISLVAAVPGTFTGPASRAYLYYTDEHKHWVDGIEVEVAARK